MCILLILKCSRIKKKSKIILQKVLKMINKTFRSEPTCSTDLFKLLKVFLEA